MSRPPILLLNSVAECRQNDAVCMQAAIESFMTPEECQRVLALSDALPSEEGGYNVSADGTSHREEHHVRKSEVKYLWPGADCMWLFEKLDRAVDELNKTYQLDLSGFAEGVQVARYTEGGHYTWHSDLGPGTVSTRKLSLIVQLSDEDDYSGGEVDFITIPKEMPKKLGTLIAFPAYMVHRVKPVTSGLRRSLVSWVHGNVFR